jgi:hypothetical protein
MQSFQSLLGARCGTNGRNPEDGKDWTILTIVQQILKVAVLFPILGKALPRDLSPLKPVLVEGVWDRVRKGLVPLEAGGTSR